MKQARFKQSRRFGVAIFGHPKELKRGPKPLGKMTEYGKQLTEKQKLKAYYGMSEKQMERYMKDASKKARQGFGLVGDLLVDRCERRLDNLVYRAGFASSIRQARQMVVHGHIAIDGLKRDIPSMEVIPGQTLGLTSRGKKHGHLLINLGYEKFRPSYLSWDQEKQEAKLERNPERGEVPIELTDSLVVEYYSRFQ